MSQKSIDLLLPPMSRINCLLGFLLICYAPVLFAGSLEQDYELAKAKWSTHDKITALIAAYEAHMAEESHDLQLSLQMLQEAANLSEKTGDKIGLMASFFFLGNEYNRNNNLTKSIESYIRCEKYAEEFHDNYYLSRGLMGIGLIHYKQERWQNAYAMFYRSLSVSRSLNDKLRLARQYYLCGLCEGRLGEFRSSLMLLDSAYSIFKEQNQKEALTETQIGRAYALRNMGFLDSAKVLYNAVLLERENSNDTSIYPLIICKTGLGEIEMAKGNLGSAFSIALEAEREAKKDPYSSWITLDLYQLLFRVYKAKGDYQKALEYNQKYQHLHDTARNWEAGVLAIEQQTLFDFEKKQAVRESQYQNELSTQKKTRIGLSIVAGALLLLIVVIFLAYRAVSRQRKLSEKLLLNILPEETANELKKYGAAIPKKHGEVSIIFADIKGFTHIAESVSPENIVKKLDTFFGMFDTIMEKHGVEKIKTIGDAYMAVAGLNGSCENPSLVAVEAAWEILQGIPQLNDTHDNKSDFNFRIGIHTGSVISGVVGKNKYGYDVWGDSVNVAARMEQNSTPGHINISGTTWSKVCDHFQCRHRGKVPAKNKGEIDMYFVEGKILIVDKT